MGESIRSQPATQLGTALLLAFALGLPACGGSGDSLEDDPGGRSPKAAPIAAFDAMLITPTAVRIEYRLRRPADLSLLVEGTKRDPSYGVVPFDAEGNHPDPAVEPAKSPEGRAVVRVHFERGPFNFSSSPRLRFTLRATVAGEGRSESSAVTLNRDGLFGRRQVEAAIRSLDE